ncbi:hypothetical protein [Sulfurisphaera javensis]|uniref:hypothetical protein n=1 Tax=Sulfurisphaera javensis TaxID=2049879 RepID=UPI0034E8DFC3
MLMKILLILILMITIISPLTFSYTIYISYPKTVMIGQNFTITSDSYHQYLTQHTFNT